MHVDGDRLQDYVDRRLADVEREAVRQHVAQCDRCAAEVRSLEALISDLSSLAEAVQPNRDLLPGIHAQMDEARADELREARRARLQTLTRVAAVLALIVTSSAITALAMRSAGDDKTSAPPLARTEAATFLQAHADYARAAQELEALLQERGAELPSGTLEALESSLAVIDAALLEATNALEADPGNPILSEMLLAGYEKKLDVLRRATTFPSL